LDGRKEYSGDLPGSPELRAIFDEEMALDSVPQWALNIVRRMFGGPIPTCGHYSFPRPIMQVCEAIGAETCPEFVVGCYTADGDRKIRMIYCVFCLDAWCKEAPLDLAKAELATRDNLGKDWGHIIEAVYATLGPITEQKALLVRRLIHRLRWWIKTHIWSDDKRDRFFLDACLGDVRGTGDWGEYGDTGFGDPYTPEFASPEVVSMEKEICRSIPDGIALLEDLRHNHLCGPKAFRIVERLIVRIGAVGLDKAPNYSSSVLDCEDTLPDFVSARRWYASFMESLEAWLNGNAGAVPELGSVTPVKHWLARILRLRLRLLEEDKESNFSKLVGCHSSGKTG
jgi:hypothetical protein